MIFGIFRSLKTIEDQNSAKYPAISMAIFENLYSLVDMHIKSKAKAEIILDSKADIKKYNFQEPRDSDNEKNRYYK